MGDDEKALLKSKVDNVHGLPHIHQAGHLVIKGDQIDQEGPALPKITLFIVVIFASTLYIYTRHIKY